MLALIIVPFAVAVSVAVLGRRLGRWSFVLGAVGPAFVLAWAAGRAGTILAGQVGHARLGWVDGLDLALQFRIDGFALLFLLVIGIAGPPIFLYAASTMQPGRNTARFAALMTTFSGAMTGLVISDHLLTLFFFWEATTVLSYLLIGHADKTAKARSAALQAILVTGAGGLAMLAGLLLLAGRTGTWLLSELHSATASPETTLAWALILLGAVTKSAQFPFHGWLPGAMAAPTAASAFLHSATMVKAGILLVGRLAPVAVQTEAWWSDAVVVIGLATMVVGGWAALGQTDLKLLLAHGTVSQLGFLFLLVGYGEPSLTFAGLAMVGAHALFKAGLFLTVGTIDSMTGTREIGRLARVTATSPLLAGAGIAAGLSMAGIPFTAGFVAKEAAVDSLLERTPVLIAVIAASVLTVAYTGRFLLGAFRPTATSDDQAPASNPGLGASVLAPLTLAGVGVILGLYPAPLAEVVDSAATAVATPGAGKLVAWPGLVPALGWSAVSVILGAIAVIFAQRLESIRASVGAVTSRIPSSRRMFDAGLTATIRLADRTTGSIQSGSLPAYVSIILGVAVTAPTIAAMRQGPTFGPVDRPRLHAVVLAIIVVASAVGAARASRRFTSVLFLGGVGYGVAGMYASLGGPDLVLTQVLVETLAVALFALALRRLPPEYGTSTARRWRLPVSVAVGAFILGAGLLVGSDPVAESVSTEYVARAVPEAAGQNVVNVILVDFRALDTLGEVAVITVATLGAAGLVAPILRRERESSS